MNKMNRLIALSLIFSGITSAAYAEELTRWILASTQSRGMPVAIRQEADHVVLPVILTSTQKNPDKRVDDLNQALEDVRKKVKDASTIRLLEAQLDLSAGAATGLPDMRFSEKESATLTIHIVVSPRFRGDNFLARAEELSDFADKLILGAVDVAIGKVQLGVKNPENYRTELLEKIMGEMSRLRKMAGPETILHISGLEGPVEARQIDQENVELFINYRLTLEQWGTKDPASFPDR